MNIPLPSMRPDFSLEAEHTGIVCGADEAGRGPMAGPVVAAAVIVSREAELPKGLNDSKKVTPARRDALYEWIVEHTHWAVTVVDAEEIDRINILRASLSAMARSIAKLDPAPHVALIDGNIIPDETACVARAVVGGDGRSVSIAAASIIAKVTRDRLMHRYAQAYPMYGFDRHMGYCTQEHLQALRAHGPCPLHRRSFAPVRRVLEEMELV